MRTQNPRFRLAATVAVTALLLSQVLPQPAMAQGAPPPLRPAGAQDQQGADPPTRVGRLAQLSGTVSFHAQDEDQWNPATLNFPVVQGNAFWTEPNAQAVIEVSASRIAMAPGTELDVATLTDTAFQATEAQGELYLRVRATTPDETYAVQTPRGLVTLTAPGRYGVVAGDTQSATTVTVVEGAARIEGPGVSLDVGPNQTASVTGSDTFQGEVGPAQRDAFLTAMLASERPPPQQAVAPPPAVAAMPGGDDLAGYGSWSDSPDYGQVWYPQVAQDWVPYRDGRWAYVAPWGWTWVDNAPWGFAPFHYGRWVEAGGRWGWIPGVGVGAPRPVYAPALVTFLGVGAVAGIGIGAALAGGRVGWLPLGPREPFHPWYRASDRYFRQVNVTHVANFTTINRNVATNNFVNRRAATVVPSSAMTASRPVAGSFQRVDPALLAQARPVLGQQPLRPAPTTVGVTPVVARQLGLPPPLPSKHTIAPGPTFRAAPAGVSTGVAAGALMGRQALPTLHNPAQPNPPVAAGAVRPFIATPGLRTPAPGQIAPPTIQRGPGFAGQGAGSQIPPLVNRGSGAATPAIVTRESPQFQRAPGATFQQTTPPTVLHAPPTSPAAVGAPPLVTNTAPVTTPPAVFRAPPPVVARTPPPPAIANAPPAQMFHAPPPVVTRTPPPPAIANAPPAQVFHAPPPIVARTPPPPAIANAPPAQVFHPPPPWSFRTPPPPVTNTAPAAVHVAPNSAPQFHAPPPQATLRPPPPPPQNARQKRPGEP